MRRDMKLDTKNKWTATKDALPEEDGRYVIAVEVNGILYSDFDYFDRFGGGEGSWLRYRDYPVRYWAYLPWPPKEE